MPTFIRQNLVIVPAIGFVLMAICFFKPTERADFLPCEHAADW
jgi:hypothetical protein